MNTAKTIEHNGVVKNIEEDSIVVSIIKNSGCASCQAKESCNVSETEEKEIEVKEFEQNYTIGEQVKVYFNESLGFRALLLGYVLPFLLVLTLLIVLTVANISEGKAGLIALGSLVPYYLVLYITKEKQRKTFSFSIKKA